MSAAAESAVRRVAIIGGGISGLAAAHHLQECDRNSSVTLFEASERLGGVLQTIRRNGFLIERSADNFITNVPGAVELCRRLGLENQLQPTTSDRRAFVVRKGRLYEVPSGFSLMAPAKIWPMLTTPILSPWGKLRMLCEYFIPRRKTNDPDGTPVKDHSDESLASFVQRRLGKEVFDRLVQPLIGGIYTADPEQLSLRATMPRFLDMERNHGGLIRGMRKSVSSTADSTSSEKDSSGARYGLFVTLQGGMSVLVDALAVRIGESNIRLNSPVERMEQLADGRWRLFVKGESLPQEFDAVILATPAVRAAKLLETFAADLSQELRAIPHASSAVVCVAYRNNQFSRPLAGFGLVVPRVERRSILSVSYASLKYSGRAPDGTVLLRVFFGGAMQPEMAAKSDQELLDLTRQELGELLGLSGQPLLHEIVRWRETMPQFHLGHVGRAQRIIDRAAKLPNFALCGNAFRGVGIPHCIRSGEKAAEQICHFTAKSVSA